MDKKLHPALQITLATKDLEKGPIEVNLYSQIVLDGEPDFIKPHNVRRILTDDEVTRLKGFLMPLVNSVKDENGLVG